MIRKFYILPLIIVVLNGCVSAKINNLDSYHSVPLQNTDVMPSKSDLSGSKSRIVVFPLQDDKWPGTGEQASDFLIKELNATKSVVIVDRNLARNLGQEIQLAETKGNTGYQGQEVADYAIAGKVTEVGAGISYTAPSQSTDKNGKVYYTNATCTISGEASISLRILKIPSLDTINTLDEKANASSTQATNWSGCPQLTKGQANGIVVAALETAVRKIHNELKNQFAPAGYIIDRRQNGKDDIFKTTLGRTGGAQEGETANVIRSVITKNPLTGDISTEQLTVASGVVSDQIGNDYSFIIISDDQKANEIKLGDKVQIQFQDSLSDNLIKLIH